MSPNDHRLNENHAHDWAYRFYEALGPSRSYRKVAREMGAPVWVIRHWARLFEWQERLEQQRRRVHCEKMVRLAKCVLIRSIIGDDRRQASAGL